MDAKKRKLLRPFNILYGNRDWWYFDHQRRLDDAKWAGGYDRERPVDLDEISLAAGIKLPGPTFEG